MNIDDEILRAPEPLAHLTFNHDVWANTVMAAFTGWCLWCAFLVLTTR